MTILRSILCCCFLVFANSALAVTINLDPKSGFLRTENDPGASNAVAIDLFALGFSAGSQIRLTGTGSYDRGGGFGTFFDLIGVFSSSSTLLPANNTFRVLGAVAAGTGVTTLPTNFGGSTTDIPEDFWISAYDGSVRSVAVTIPASVQFLFVGAADTYFEDNLSNGNWAVDVSSITAIPLPASIWSLLGSVLLIGFVQKRRSKSV